MFSERVSLIDEEIKEAKQSKFLILDLIMVVLWQATKAGNRHGGQEVN